MRSISSFRNSRAAAAVLILGAIALASGACSKSGKNPPAASGGQNVLLAEWSGPYGGVPPFGRVKVEQFKPALEMAMKEGLIEVEKIAANPEAPTFENTIAAMERGGETAGVVCRPSTTCGPAICPRMPSGPSTGDGAETCRVPRYREAECPTV